MSDLITKTVTVQFVNQPKDGRKTGSIKCADGGYIDVWPDQLHRFEKGKTYTIKCEPRDYNGKTYYTFKEMGVQEAPAAGHNNPPANGNGNDYEGKKQEAIYVCGVVNSAVGAGLIKDENALRAWTNFALAAWRDRTSDLENPY